MHPAFSELHVSRYQEIPQQTEAHSFGDISKAVIFASSSVTGALSCALLCLYDSCEIQFRTKNFHL
jgi:hypothetical protein